MKQKVLVLLFGVLSFLISKLFILSIFSTKAFSYEVSHLLKPYGNNQTMISQNVCMSSGMSAYYDLNCSPALFTKAKDAGVFIYFAGKAEGRSIDTGKELILEKITANRLRALFENANYNTFTFSAGLEFLTPYFKVFYSPYYLVADSFIGNPAFPEVALGLANQKTLGVTSGVDFNTPALVAPLFNKLYIGGTFSYYARTMANTSLTIADLSLRPEGELIQFHDTRGVALDIGMHLENTPNNYLFGVVMKNIFDQYQVDEQLLNSSNRIEYTYIWGPYAYIYWGKKFESDLGELAIGSRIYYDGYFQYSDYEKSALFASFDLGFFTMLGSYSKYHRGAGLLFNSRSYAVGVNYFAEKDIYNYDIEEERSAYLFVELKMR